MKETGSIGINEEEFSRLAGKYRNFLLSCASENTGRYITESDDEYSVALSAFHEAVQSYDETKGSFLGLAKMIISRRLTDYRRRENKYRGTVSYEEAYERDEEQNEAGAVLKKEAEIANDRIAQKSRQEELQYEISEIKKVLANYGFSFFDLTGVSPKAEKTRTACSEAIVCILDSRELCDKMRKTGTLPLAELVKMSGIPRKILERHRKYIIAGAEIFLGDYPYLAGYMSYVRKLRWQKEAEK